MRVEQILPQEIQQLVDIIESQDLILAEILLDEITDMPNYNQVLRVCDTNIALSQGYFNSIAKRILIHKVEGTELDLGLPVPNWERYITDNMAIVDEEGNRLLFETKYYNHVYNEETEEMEEVLIDTKYTPKLVNTLKGLILMSKNEPLLSLFEKFTHQYVSDMLLEDINFFKRLK